MAVNIQNFPNQRGLTVRDTSSNCFGKDDSSFLTASSQLLSIVWLLNLLLLLQVGLIKSFYGLSASVVTQFYCTLQCLSRLH